MKMELGSICSVCATYEINTVWKAGVDASLTLTPVTTFDMIAMNAVRYHIISYHTRGREGVRMHAIDI